MGTEHQIPGFFICFRRTQPIALVFGACFQLLFPHLCRFLLVSPATLNLNGPFYPPILEKCSPFILDSGEEPVHGGAPLKSVPEIRRVGLSSVIGLAFHQPTPALDSHSGRVRGDFGDLEPHNVWMACDRKNGPKRSERSRRKSARTSSFGKHLRL